MLASVIAPILATFTPLHRHRAVPLLRSVEPQAGMTREVE